MTRQYTDRGPNRHKIRDPPLLRDYALDAQDNHARSHEDAEGECEAEFVEDFGDFLEEGRVVDFFCGGAPGHVDGEEVREDGLGDVHGEAADEDGHEGEPLGNC